MSHYIKKCAYCSCVISQCRCPSRDKPVTVGVCAKCWHERRDQQAVPSASAGSMSEQHPNGGRVENINKRNDLLAPGDGKDQ